MMLRLFHNLASAIKHGLVPTIFLGGKGLINGISNLKSSNFDFKPYTILVRKN